MRAWLDRRCLCLQERWCSTGGRDTYFVRPLPPELNQAFLHMLLDKGPASSYRPPALSTYAAVVCSTCRWRGSSGRGTPLLAYCAAPLKPSGAGKRRPRFAKLTMPWRGIAELKFRIHSPPAGSQANRRPHDSRRSSGCPPRRRRIWGLRLCAGQLTMFAPRNVTASTRPWPCAHAHYTRPCLAKGIQRSVPFRRRQRSR